MGNVRAKFACVFKTEKVDGFEVELLSVTDADGEGFWKWAPYGKLHMGLVRKETADRFKVGATYYVDLTPVEG